MGLRKLVAAGDLTGRASSPRTQTTSTTFLITRLGAIFVQPYSLAVAAAGVALSQLGELSMTERTLRICSRRRFHGIEREFARIYKLNSRKPLKELTDFFSDVVSLQILDSDDNAGMGAAAAGEQSVGALGRDRP
ncbi:hypothetical protein Adt_43999 [Abeliophyllum distichum]|uniref:Uncharacterized protein n=1 Tax=Abeliophyllum distichum TaxID=126358 RepID=A0ABD1P9M2_9LAMI